MGEGGGGMATALGILARGVLIVGRDLEGVPVGVPNPTADGLPLRAGLGVENGDPRVGEDMAPVDRVGLLIDCRGARGESLVVSCFAVIPRYLAAREPVVIDPGVLDPLRGGTGFETCRGRADGVTPGVTRPEDIDGVTLPRAAGVILPVESMFEGVTLPLAEGVARPEKDGVFLPL